MSKKAKSPGITGLSWGQIEVEGYPPFKDASSRQSSNVQFRDALILPGPKVSAGVHEKQLDTSARFPIEQYLSAALRHLPSKRVDKFRRSCRGLSFTQ